MKSLSRREKVLIYVLLLLVIVMAGWFLFIQTPLKKQSKLKIQLNEIESQHLMLSATQIDYTGLDENLAAAQALNEQLSNVFYKSDYYVEDVDESFTSNTINHSLIPMQLSIEMSLADPLYAFGKAPNEEGEVEKKEETTEETEETPELMVPCYTITQQVVGTSSNIYAYVDSIKDDTAKQLVNLAMFKDEDKEGVYSASLSYKVYLKL